MEKYRARNLLPRKHAPSPLHTPVCLLCEISYRYFEKKMLHMKVLIYREKLRVAERWSMWCTFTFHCWALKYVVYNYVSLLNVEVCGVQLHFTVERWSMWCTVTFHCWTLKCVVYSYISLLCVEVCEVQLRFTVERWNMWCTVTFHCCALKCEMYSYVSLLNVEIYGVQLRFTVDRWNIWCTVTFHCCPGN
jgi:hypothetical protein